MAHPLSGHLLNASLLATAAALALAADRISVGPASPARDARPGDALGDIGAFVSAVGAGSDSGVAPLQSQLRIDPWDAARGTGISVASQPGSPTVSTRPQPGRQLTAILIADNKPVAVVDDELVKAGDRLRDGALVSRIQADRVFIVEKSGRWRTLTLASGRP